jgi:hypothetical protein
VDLLVDVMTTTPRPFSKWDWIFWDDIERCPYHPFSFEAVEWSWLQDDEMYMRALERYADYLITTRSTAELGTDSPAVCAGVTQTDRP